MRTIPTAPNILTTIDIPFTGLNAKSNRWEIKYSIKKTNLIEGVTSTIVGNNTISIFDTPETPIIDEEGNQTGTNPATTELTDFMASWSDIETLTEQSYQRVIDHENIVEWDGTIIDDIENDPDADVVQPWVVGELVAPPNRRSYEGKVYEVVQPHTTLANWTPNIVPALFTYLFDEDNGGEGLQPWVQPVGSSDAYPMGAQVTHNGQCWENTGSAANVWEPGVFGWVTITCP